MPAGARRPRVDSECAFCPGNEHVAGPELMRIASTGQYGWSLRVLSEKKANSSGEEIRRNSGARRENDSRVQEIVVETHDHSLDLALLPEVQFSAILRTVKERYDQLSAERSFAHVSLWKNQGNVLVLGWNIRIAGWLLRGGAAPGLKVDATSVL